MRSGNTEYVESGSSASGPRPQAKASVRWMGLRRARPSFPTPWSNVERREEGFFLLCPYAEADKQCTLGVVSGVASGLAQDKSSGARGRVKEVIHAWAMFVRWGEGQIDEAPEVGGQTRRRLSRQSVSRSCSCCGAWMRVSCPTAAY